MGKIEKADNKYKLCESRANHIDEKKKLTGFTHASNVSWATIHFGFFVKNIVVGFFSFRYYPMLIGYFSGDV